MRRLTEWVRKKGTEDTAFAHFIQFVYLFFANSYVQAIVSIVGTVVIAVMIGQAYYGIWFWVASGLYAIVTSFHTRELVKDAFCVHEACAERENGIHQYICIPISPAGLGVTFLLQVDTNEQGLFGSSKTAVNDFGKNTIYPYAQLLHMIYEQSRVIEQLTA